MDTSPIDIQEKNLPVPKRQEIKVFYIIIIVLVIVMLILGVALVFLGKEQKYPATLNQNPTDVTEGKCYIDNLPYASGASSSQNECQVCSPNLDRSPWVNKEDGVSCRNNMGVCKKGQCVPKIAPQTIQETATDSATGKISSPPNNR